MTRTSLRPSVALSHMDESNLPQPRKRKRTLSSQFESVGTDTTVRGQRKAAGKKRKPAIAYKNHAVKLSAAESEVIYEMCDTFDVGLSRILRRFVQDAIRKYAKETGHPQWIDAAGLGEKPKSNPFDEMGATEPARVSIPSVSAQIAAMQSLPPHYAMQSPIPSDVVLPGGVGYVPTATQSDE